ncbi:MAG: 16S rRNA (guanine(966)-N(2))-methyltransferase RsmD [Maricaulaceae bacterium]|jgi:16S rRNA (guanine966-N2)-methyltransferase
MRIVTGAHKGRTLVTPKGTHTRPTAARTREAVFNRLAHDPEGPALEGARVIDLFAGSGALGFEALSRGAGFVLFVDTDAAARGTIRTNAEALGEIGRCRIHRRPAEALGDKPAGLGAPFDLAFLDPPYRQGLATRALEALARGGWLAEGARVVVEVGHDEPDPEAEGYVVDDVRIYGEAKVAFLRRVPR